MNPLNFIRVKDRKLSLWQSAVEKYIRLDPQGKNPPLSKREALAHPLSIATAHYVSNKYNNKTFEPVAPAKDDGSPDAWVYKSHLGFLTGQALAANKQELANELAVQYRQFSDEDYSIGPPPTGFATCPVTYAEYLSSTDDTMTYNDWTVAGNNDLSYGVIGWQLPNDATIGIIGDWGTGLDDAMQLLKDMMVQHSPAAIIHLGDIYYSGTPDECQDYFANIFTTVFNEVLGENNRIPVFSLAGNHDYYAWGAPFYNVVNGLNNYSGITDAIQPASYFCLRSEDNGWQFLAMDTGYHDSDPADQGNATYAGPWLRSNEILWHQDKMNNFSGNTILLSHHQLFSSNSAINGQDSVMNAVPYFNIYLYQVFSEYIPNNVAAWIWGHEHNFVMYSPGISQLPTATLIGNSAYEELTASDPYVINYPQIPYLFPEPGYDQYKLGTNADSNGVTYYNHGYAIIDLSVRKNPTDPVQISYYQFPAWGDLPPSAPVSTFIYGQSLQPQAVSSPVAVISGDNYYLSNSDGMSIQPYYEDLDGNNYPQALPGPFANAVLMTILDGNNTGQQVMNGDTIIIQSTEAGLAQAGNYITVPEFTSSLYYSSNSDSSVLWTINKCNPGNDPVIHIGDTFYLESQYYPGTYMTPDYSIVSSLIYLTTGNNNWWWQFNASE